MRASSVLAGENITVLCAATVLRTLSVTLEDSAPRIAETFAASSFLMFCWPIVV